VQAVYLNQWVRLEPQRIPETMQIKHLFLFGTEKHASFVLWLVTVLQLMC